MLDDKGGVSESVALRLEDDREGADEKGSSGGGTGGGIARYFSIDRSTSVVRCDEVKTRFLVAQKVTVLVPLCKTFLCQRYQLIGTLA